jgi:lysophospholipase L1-like esterase
VKNLSQSDTLMATSSATPAAPPTLSFKKQLLFFVIVSVCLLSLAEVSVRLWAFFFRTSYERYNPTTQRLELVPNLRFNVGPEEFRINSKGFLGRDFDQKKPEGTFRIISMGDSCTFTNGVWARAYPALLERLLTKDASPKAFEVINAGIEGYNSTLTRARLTDEILSYNPDMVTIYIGWNDLMKTSPQDTSPSGQIGILARIKQESYLFKAYRKLIFFYLRPLFSKPEIHVDRGQAHPFDGYVPVQYRDNVEAMIKLLKAKHIKVMLFTLSTVVTPEMSQNELKKQHVVFPYYAGAFDVPSLLALVRAYNAVILELSSKYAVPIVDLNAVFNEQDKRKLFWDTMHPSYPGHEVVAKAIDHRISQIRQDARQCRLYGWEDLCSAVAR